MASLAMILKDLNNDVKGADVDSYVFTQDELIKKNIVIESLSNMNYQDSDIIIVGNSFLNKYDFNGKIIKTYEEMLYEISRNYYSIAVCGTHGKTSTSNMIKHVLSSTYKTSFLIGDGSGKAFKDGKYFVFEACEHRRHFLTYKPDLIVCLNIDYDHVEYFNNEFDYNNAFFSFFKQAKDKIFINEKIKYSGKNVITFGYDNKYFKIKKIKFNKKGTFLVIKEGKERCHFVTLPFYGKEIFDDVIACIMVCLYLGVSLKNIINSLKSYQAAKRRMNIDKIKSNIIVDDYGHHPREIIATIEALKQRYPKKKIIIFYHPDRPKRLVTFYDYYKKAFDSVTLTYVFPFINNDVEKQEAYNSLIDNQRILPVSEFVFNKNYNNMVFLFTGSKDMSKMIKRLKESLLGFF